MPDNDLRTAITGGVDRTAELRRLCELRPRYNELYRLWEKRAGTNYMANRAAVLLLVEAFKKQGVTVMLGQVKSPEDSYNRAMEMALEHTDGLGHDMRKTCLTRMQDFYETVLGAKELMPAAKLVDIERTAKAAAQRAAAAAATTKKNLGKNTEAGKLRQEFGGHSGDEIGGRWKNWPEGNTGAITLFLRYLREKEIRDLRAISDPRQMLKDVEAAMTQNSLLTDLTRTGYVGTIKRFLIEVVECGDYSESDRQSLPARKPRDSRQAPRP